MSSMNRTKHANLKAELLALAARPEGFAKSEIRGDRASVTSIVRGMVAKQPVRLFTAFVTTNHVRYFDTAARAADYVMRHAVAIRPAGNTTPVGRKRGVSAPAGPAVTPAHVQVQVCPGIERAYQPQPRVLGGFATAGIGRYPLPGTWSDNVLRNITEAS